MSERVQYPQIGCICEFLEGNTCQIALVIGSSGERLRLLLPNRRETTLAQNRLLPWLGPLYTKELSRDESIRLLEEHKKRRQERCENSNVLEVWELVQGEMAQATVQTITEFVEKDPDCDTVAAYGRALLQARSYFRFQPPTFQILTAEESEKRLQEQKKREEREALLGGGRVFFQMLWDVSQGKRTLPDPAGKGAGEWPEESIQERLCTLLEKRITNPDDTESEALWRELAHGLPEAPYVPLQLLIAWGKRPPHYNVWLAQTDYVDTDTWWQSAEHDVTRLMDEAERAVQEERLAERSETFVSIDSAVTQDIDDALSCVRHGDGWRLTLALASHAYFWRFDSDLDALVRKRATSLYLPERVSHMLPECLGVETYSLWAGKKRPAFLLDLTVDASGAVTSCVPSFGLVTIAANLHYDDCEAVLDGGDGTDAAPYGDMLREAHAMAVACRNQRIRNGAVLMERQDPYLRLNGEGNDIQVILEEAEPTPESQAVVSESMIAGSAGLASYALEHGIPMFFRTQDIEIPKENAGIWSRPEDMYRVMHGLMPSILETEAAPHAALAVAGYTPCTSPLRRYVDLVNVAQIAGVLRDGVPARSREEMDALLAQISPVLDAVSQVQKQRPRYWKLLYFRQQGPSVWWDGVVCDETDLYVMVSLPKQSMYLRGKRRLFDDRCSVGSAVRVRIGKVQPLWNDIQILEAETVQ